MEYVIITGGSGYLGSNITKLLLSKGYGVISIDRRLGLESPGLIRIQLDLCNISKSEILSESGRIIQLINGSNISGLIHMAAWKDLPGSYNNPDEYYRNNLVSCMNALLIANSVRAKIVLFSSSAGVYSEALTGSVKESDETNPQSPYGYSKLVCERLVSDISKEYGLNSVNMRYCNPMGVYDTYNIDLSDSMFGNIVKSIKDNSVFTIYGGDYNTLDGTPIRDYIDVYDIARAHLYFLESNLIGRYTVNIGTGIGVTCKSACDIVKSLVPEFRYEIGPRREGDAAGSWADVSKLNSMGFKCNCDIHTSISNLVNNFIRINNE